MKKLPMQFYNRTDVVKIAAELIGKIIVTNIDDYQTAGRIVETEAYIGIADKASHSFNGRRTARNEHMYAQAGTGYVYICYGMHYLFNVITNKKGIPDAVLIRALEPVNGVDIMLQRTNKPKHDFTLTKGPGNLSKALGINKTHSGLSLLGNEIYLADDGYKLSKDGLGISGRVGIEGAGREAVLLPYRFYVRGNKYVSGRPNK